MKCRNCGSENCHMVTESETKTKGYDGCLGCLGMVLLSNPLGLLCGLCGMGDSKTRTKHYWVCNNCGRKFIG